MGEADMDRKQMDGSLDGIFSLSSTRVFWQSRRRRRAPMNKSAQDAAIVPNESSSKTPKQPEEYPSEEQANNSTRSSEALSERRKALFEPLEPTDNLVRKRQSAESLLPPPDFDSANYPKGWLVGKKRKLVNVDVVESMRRIAVQEMNRKDREINGLNEQLEEDARCLEHLQIQLLEEKRKRAEVERENTMFQDQINMLMTMLQDNENIGEEVDRAEEQNLY